jgi:deoxyribodipyrimidine photo-lyase
METVIWWIRRDIRINQNPTLRAAIQSGLPVIPLFILDPFLLTEPATNRQHFLLEALQTLDLDLQSIGNKLLIRRGKPLDVLQTLINENQVRNIFAEEDYSPYAIQRDTAIQKLLPLKLVTGLVLHHPELIHKSDGSPYSKYTSFKNAWKSLLLPGISSEPLNYIPAAQRISQSVILEKTKTLQYFPANEREAQIRLKEFIDNSIHSYHDNRNRMDLNGTSSLSPYLRFGLISIHQLFDTARKALLNAPDSQARQGIDTWINELIWREFYINILYHNPFVLKTAYYPNKRNIPWRIAPEELSAWQSGHTGYPVVDACMRQLLVMGWMHNRGRMIVASFLVKDLLINWQEGEKWFMKHLVDGDPAANNGGWQWSAGVGTDAAPYFRIFNPIVQSQKFDPQGNFIRAFVPELATVPDRYIHSPWLMPNEIQSEINCVIGKNYPPPIVDHQKAKERTLDAFKHS